MATDLVLLHGFTNTGASWDQVMAALPERYRPLAPDIRGHGAAASVRPVSLAGVVGDVGALAPGPFDLVGYSMGGRLALHVALALPGRVRRLVLIGASPGHRRRGCAGRAPRGRRRPGRRGGGDDDRGLRRALGQDGGAGRPAARGPGALCRPSGCGTPPPGWPPRCAVWARARCPRCGTVWVRCRRAVELVVGERDAKFQAIAGEMAAALPDARVQVIGGAGHAVHLEAPGRVTQVIAEA